jgi:hypothetical protein
MRFPYTSPEKVCTCNEINHRQVSISDALETVYISTFEGLDKSKPEKENFPWFKRGEENITLCVCHSTAQYHKTQQKNVLLVWLRWG